MVQRLVLIGLTCLAVFPVSLTDAHANTSCNPKYQNCR